MEVATDRCVRFISTALGTSAVSLPEKDSPMRNALTRRSSAIALAGVLALAGAACGDDGEDTDVEVTEDTGGGETTVEQETTMEETTEMGTSTEMGTETATE